MELADIFTGDPFSVASLSKAVEDVPHQPRQLGDSGLFVPDPHRTEVVGIQYVNGSMRVAPLDERGAPIQESGDDERSFKFIKTGRVAVKKRIKASELQFTAQFGGDLGRVQEAVQSEIARHLSGTTGLKAQCENRLEAMRLGCLSGLITDQHGNVRYDYYRDFDVPEPPRLDLDMSLKDGNFREEVQNKIVKPLQRKYGMKVPIHIYGGESAMSMLATNPEYYESYKVQQAGEALREDTTDKPIKFAGATWEEYIGSQDQSISIPDDEFRVVIGGASGAFVQVMSPGEAFSDMGQLGKDWYSWVDIDPSSNPSWVDVHLATYPMMVSKRPDLSMKVRAIKP